MKGITPDRPSFNLEAGIPSPNVISSNNNNDVAFSEQGCLAWFCAGVHRQPSNVCIVHRSSQAAGHDKTVDSSLEASIRQLDVKMGSLSRKFGWALQQIVPPALLTYFA